MDTQFDFYETSPQSAFARFPWKSVLMFIGMITIIIVVIYFFAKAISHRKKRNSRRRPHKYRNRGYSTIASDDIQTIYEAHVNDQSDPLVAVYNRPDIVAKDEVLRQDIARRMRATIMADSFDDIEMLERIVQINEDLDLDDNITRIAPMIAARVGHVNNVNFTVRANDAMRLVDDPQNVHDPVVIKELNSVLKEYSGEYTGSYNYAIDGNVAPDVNATIVKMVNMGEISESRANDAKRVMSKMISSNDTCSSYSNRRESEIFQTAWSAANTYDKKYNIILGLADSVSGPSGTVCMNGRIARVLGANTTQASSAELKSAVYSYAGKVMNSSGDFREVVKYINDIEQFTDSQKNILVNECKSVFDDLNETGDAPIGTDTNNDSIIQNHTVDNGVSGINNAYPTTVDVTDIPLPTPIANLDAGNIDSSTSMTSSVPTVESVTSVTSSAPTVDSSPAN